MRRPGTCIDNGGIKAVLCGFVFLVAQAPAFSLTRDEYNVLSRRSHGDVLAGHMESAMQQILPLSRSPYADARLFVDLADCYRQEYGEHSMQVAAAKDCCGKALALDPSFGPAYDMLGQIASVQAKQDEAIKQYTKALSVSEPDKNAWYHRAKSYASSHRYNEAIVDLDAFDKYRKTEFPKEPIPAIHLIRGQIYQGAGKYELAVASYRKSYPKYKNDWTERQILECLIKANKLPDAINELSNRIKSDPEDEQSYFLRAGLEVQLKQFQKAIADYTSAIAIDPTSTYYKARAKVYQAVGENELSKKDLEKAGIPAH